MKKKDVRTVPLCRRGLKIAKRLLLYVEKKGVLSQKQFFDKKGRIVNDEDRFAVDYLCLVFNYDRNKITNRSALNEFLEFVRGVLKILLTFHKENKGGK